MMQGISGEQQTQSQQLHQVAKEHQASKQMKDLSAQLAALVAAAQPVQVTSASVSCLTSSLRTRPTRSETSVSDPVADIERLSVAEREHWRTRGLYTYRGQEGHQKEDCPKLPSAPSRPTEDYSIRLGRIRVTLSGRLSLAESEHRRLHGLCRYCAGTPCICAPEASRRLRSEWSQIGSHLPPHPAPHPHCLRRRRTCGEHPPLHH